MMLPPPHELTLAIAAPLLHDEGYWKRDEMAKNVNAVVKDQDAAATVVEAAGVVEDTTPLASLNSCEHNLSVDSWFIAF